MFFLNYNITIFFSFSFPHASSEPHAVTGKESRDIARGVTLIILLVLVGTILASYSISGLLAVLTEKLSFPPTDYLKITLMILYGIGVFVGAHLVSVGLSSLNRALRGDVG